MKKIISITNAHEFDEIEVNDKQLTTIIEALQLSAFVHTITYIEDGITHQAHVRGN